MIVKTVIKVPSKQYWLISMRAYLRNKVGLKRHQVNFIASYLLLTGGIYSLGLCYMLYNSLQESISYNSMDLL
jgi:hypothetical protein